MDRIRQALGARQLNLYGTYRGAVYASLFPRNTGKIVLDSSTPPEREAHPLTNGMPADIWPCAF
ncbi:hypothetical protein ABZU76_04840 [Amycolatopsis sp. NPDC005232]|uniref:hypothetical protein n=1 Tax=Amycolatopsis sp. NPDC005232 TaxID=3157027 RepID=UPI0033BEDDE7